MSTAAQAGVIIGVVLGLITAIAGGVVFLRKSLTDALVDRYKEVHKADVERIDQLELELEKTKTRLGAVERENETLKGLAVGRDLLTMMSEQSALQHKELMGVLEKQHKATMAALGVENV
jgi:hypothetical protein